MGNSGIPLDKAVLLAALLEALLYGFSLLMFGGTIWVLLSKRPTGQVNHKMFTVACLLLLFSTTHLILDIIRVMGGLILYRDTYPGGPVAFFADTSQWTFVYKSGVYTLQTLIGDGVVLYRCYSVWQSKLVMILPVLLWFAVAVTGVGSPYSVSENTTFDKSVNQWITSFYASTFTTNLLTTLLLAFRIWYLDWKSAMLRGQQRVRLRPILRIVLDAGIIYSVTLLTALMCFVKGSNGQFVVLDMIMPIISITFYMVIIRGGLASRSNQPVNVLPVGYSPAGDGSNAGWRHTMRGHIMTLDPEQGREWPTRTIGAKSKLTMTSEERESSASANV